MEADLRVIRFDSFASAPSDGPTPFAPWRTWITGNYRLCGSLAAFRRELADAGGRVILLLHYSDLRRDLRMDEVDVLLDDPRRTAFVYSGGRVDQDRIADPRHRGRWAAVGIEHLCGDARPAAWLGSEDDLGVDLTDVARPFHTWRDAAESLVGSVRYWAENERDFLPRLISGPIRSGMSHGLNSEGSRPRTAEERRRELLCIGDRLWLLQGVAASLYWTRAVTMIAEVLNALADLLRRGTDLDDSNDPDGRSRWNDIVRKIQDATEPT